MTLALIVVTVVGTLVLVCIGAARWWAGSNVAEVEDAYPALPEGHRPPPGLGPISPSERALANEVQCGLRDLQLFLLDAA